MEERATLTHRARAAGCALVTRPADASQRLTSEQINCPNLTPGRTSACASGMHSMSLCDGVTAAGRATSPGLFPRQTSAAYVGSLATRAGAFMVDGEGGRQDTALGDGSGGAAHRSAPVEGPERQPFRSLLTHGWKWASNVTPRSPAGEPRRASGWAWHGDATLRGNPSSTEH